MGLKDSNDPAIRRFLSAGVAPGVAPCEHVRPLIRLESGYVRDRLHDHPGREETDADPTTANVASGSAADPRSEFLPEHLEGDVGALSQRLRRSMES